MMTSDEELRPKTIEDVLYKQPKKPSEVPQEEPSFLEVTGAAFRQSNTLASFANYLFADSIGRRENFDFNPIEAIKGTPYMEYADRFFDADSEEDVSIIKARIDQELSDREILMQRPVLGTVMSLAASVVDPINIVPVGGAAVRAARMGGSLASAALKSFATTGLTTAASAAIAEGALHATQEVRTIEESYAAIGGSFILGGLFGAGASVYGKYKSMKGIKAIEKDLHEPVDLEALNKAVEKTDEAIARTPDSVGAASVRKSEEELLNDNTIIPGIGTTIAKVVRNLTPEQNLIQSPSLTARRVFQDLANTSHILNKNLDGVATDVPVETLISRWNAPLAEFLQGQKKAYLNYSKNTTNPISWSAFKDQVALAATRGDTHEIPQVQQAAKLLREKILAPALERGQRFGLFPEDMKTTTALSYFPRIWDKAKVQVYRDDLKKIITDHLKAQAASKPKIDVKTLKERRAEVLAKQEDLLDQLDAVTDLSQKRAIRKELDALKAEYVDITTSLVLSDKKASSLSNYVDGVIDNILGLQDGVHINTRDVMPDIRGSARARLFDIPDEVVREFLVTDTEVAMKGYLNTTIPDIEIMGRYGDLRLTDQIAAIDKEYEKLIAAEKSPKAKLALAKRRDNDKKDIEFILQRLRNVRDRQADPDSTISNAQYAARSLAYMIYLGKQTLSSIPDLARLIEINGFKGLFRDAIIPMIKNWKDFKLSSNEAKLAGEALEVVLNNHRLQVMTDLKNPPLGQGRFKMGLKATTDLFTKLSGINHMDAARKQIMGVILQRKNIDNMRKWVDGKLSKNEIAALARFGIEEGDAARILRMWDKHGRKEGNLYIAGTANWEDEIAVDAFRNLLNRQINHYATMPGVATAPRFMSSEVGRLFFMFQQFNMAATSKILISGLNEKNANIMFGWATSIALGMTAYAINSAINGYEVSDDPMQWLAEGVDRSGIGGFFATTNDYLDIITDSKVTASRLIGVERSGGYDASIYKRLVKLGGPAADMFVNMATVASGPFSDRGWQSDNTRALRKLMPFQNLFYLSWLFDEMEEGINSELGVNR